MLKYSKLIIFILFINFGVCLNAQNSNQNSNENKSETVVNEILFFAAGESSTLRDLQIYQSVLSEVFKKNRISQFTIKLSDDFMLSRLIYKEAIFFGLQGTEVKVTEAMKKKLAEYSQAEINREVEVISKAMAMIEIKEGQLKEKVRFDTWFEIIKRKYQFKLKSNKE